MTDAAGATEYSLEFSDRGTAVEASGDMADARRIQVVLFGRPRAGDSEFGLQVAKYLMEFSDAPTLDEIRDLGLGLVSRYLPDVQVNAFVVELIDAGTSPAGRGTNSVAIGVSLGQDAANSFPFAVLVTGGGSSSVVSQLVF